MRYNIILGLLLFFYSITMLYFGIKGYLSLINLYSNIIELEIEDFLRGKLLRVELKILFWILTALFSLYLTLFKNYNKYIIFIGNLLLFYSFWYSIKVFLIDKNNILFILISIVSILGLFYNLYSTWKLFTINSLKNN